MKKIVCYLTVIFIILVTINACKKMDHEYRKFVVPGGITYPGKVSMAVAYPGNNRIKISWLRGQDPSVVKARIFWNYYTDSVDVDIPPSGGDDTISVMIDSLPEKSYSFVIKTYDAKGNVSVPVELLSAAYGDQYQSSLLTRPVVSSTMGPNNTVTILWGNADISNGAYATEIKYTDTLGDSYTQRTPITDDTSIISGIEGGSNFQYRTLFLPDSLSIDTFYTAYEKNKNFVINKSNWSALVLPTDQTKLAGAQYSLDRLFDGITNNSSNIYATAGGITLPQWFTLDLGQKVTLSQMKEYQRAKYAYNGSVPLDFEIWGSNDPDLDGGWNNWTLLGTFHSYKPSGLPPGQVGDDDNTYAVIDGEDFQFDQPQPAVRYIRFKTLKTYGGDGQVVISELTFITDLVP